MKSKWLSYEPHQSCPDIGLYQYAFENWLTDNGWENATATCYYDSESESGYSGATSTDDLVGLFLEEFALDDEIQLELEQFICDVPYVFNDNEEKNGY